MVVASMYVVMGIEHRVVRKASNGDRYKVLAVKMVGIK